MQMPKFHHQSTISWKFRTRRFMLLAGWQRKLMPPFISLQFLRILEIQYSEKILKFPLFLDNALRLQRCLIFGCWTFSFGCDKCFASFSLNNGCWIFYNFIFILWFYLKSRLFIILSPMAFKSMMSAALYELSTHLVMHFMKTSFYYAPLKVDSLSAFWNSTMNLKKKIAVLLHSNLF